VVGSSAPKRWPRRGLLLELPFGVDLAADPSRAGCGRVEVPREFRLLRDSFLHKEQLT
jgi:hypothetical protein